MDGFLTATIESLISGISDVRCIDFLNRKSLTNGQKTDRTSGFVSRGFRNVRLCPRLHVSCDPRLSDSFPYV